MTVEGAHNYFANGILVHNCDEAHLLTMRGRGDALECGLMRFTEQNPGARVVLLSATMPNVEVLARWLTSLNGKPSVVVTSRWRPTELEIHWVPYEAHGGGASYARNEKSKRSAAAVLLQHYRRDRWIVFVHSKVAGRALLDELRKGGESVEFHSADLDRDARIALEDRFRHGDLRVTIATSTLAYGINMPARRVCVLGVHRGVDEVDPIDVAQEAGRAGRVGLDSRGDAYVLLPDHERDPSVFEKLRRKFSRVGPIESQLNEVNTLAFHLTAEVAEGGVETEDEAVAWHSRSLAAFQGNPLPRESGVELSAASVLRLLERATILSSDRATDTHVHVAGETSSCPVCNQVVKYEATMLGRVSSWLYYSPFDVSDWHRNFRRLVELDRLKDDDCLAWALGTVKTGFLDYLPREHDRDMGEFQWRLRAKGLETVRLPPNALVFESLLKGFEYKRLVSLKRSLVADAPRIIQAIQLIDRYVLDALGRPFLDLLGTRIRYGCSWREAELCRLPGIGAKLAGRLIEAGIDSVEKVVEDKRAVAEAIGKRRAIKAIRGAKELVGRMS